MRLWGASAIRGFILCTALVALAWAVGCAKKESSAPPPTPAVTPPAPPPKPEPEVEFTDPTLQVKYEQEFNRLVDAFQPPATGTLVAARLNDGSYIGGSLARIDTNGISLKVGKQEYVANRADLDPATEAELYVDAFARQYAMAEVSAPPPPVASNVATVLVRYALKDNLDALSGPGVRYPLVTDVMVPKGTKLEVEQRRGRWLRVVAPTLNPGLKFWVDYFQTIPLSDDLKADYAPFVLLLLESGVLTRINPDLNEVFVSAEAWAGTEPAVQEGMSRLLAVHIAQTKKASVIWVDVKSDQGNRRLAKYSRAQGFRPL